MNKSKSSPFSFGKGWSVIILAILCYWFHGAYNTDGLNIHVPICAANLGVEVGVLMTYISYASLCGVLLHIIFTVIVNKTKKASICMGVFQILAGIFFIIEINTHNVAVYLISVAVVYATVMNAAFLCMGVVINNWFPKRKGTVMGYATAGLNLCTMTCAAIGTFLINRIGNNYALIFGGACMVLGIINIIVLKDDPADRNYIPDNVSREEYEKNYATNISASSASNQWTVSKLLKTKEVWIVGLISGLFNIGTGVMISNMVARNMELGMSQNSAIATMSICAVIGVFGSIIVGMLDDKYGTKPTMIGFGIFYFIGFVINYAASLAGNNMILVWVSLVIIGSGIGGSANFTTSLAGSMFGRHNFDYVNTVLFPIQCAVTAINFLISGLVRIITDNDLKFVFLAAGVIELIAAICVVMMIKDCYKYNDDYKAAKTA